LKFFWPSFDYKYARNYLGRQVSWEDAMGDAKVEIDKDLYSRQLYVLGEEAMKKMASSSVLVSGMGGLGVEIAKNITLAGIKSLTVNDHEKATWLDLSTNFYLKSEHVKNGSNRAEACAPRLGELNPYTPVKSATENLATVDLSFFDSFKTVVLVNYPLEVQLRVNDYCHAKGIYVIIAESRGAFVVAFNDFGEGFEVMDGNGEEVLNGTVADLSLDGVVTLLPKTRHGLETGNTVRLMNVEGIAGLPLETREANAALGTLLSAPFLVRVLNPHSFALQLDGVTLSGQFKPGTATWQEVKVPFTRSHISLRQSLSQGPDFSSLITDFTKFDANLVLTAIHATHKFVATTGAQPRPWHAGDVDQIVSIAKAMASESKLEWQEEVVRMVGKCFAGQLCGLTAFMGGFLGQEVLKSLSGKFTPMSQWIMVDARELIPKEATSASSEPSFPSLAPSNFEPRGDRNDGQAIVIGRDVCEALGRQRVFMIGSGAIGCEMLKNFAMMGLGSRGMESNESIEAKESESCSGRIIVTDNDLIEKSNLNRQFLFRTSNIGQPKSVAAGRAIVEMNPDLVVESHQHKVGSDSEAVYTNAFWRGLDLVVNALDNIPARLYVDSKCVENQRPLVESGTMGTKGHVQVIVPHLTANYGSTRDPPEAGIPLCTLKSFPSQIEHTIQWAKDKWTTLFSLKPEEIKSILSDISKATEGCDSNQLNPTNDSTAYQASIESLLQKIRTKRPSKKDLKHVTSLFQSIPLSFTDCLFLARCKFESYYVNSIKQLLHVFPLEHKNDDGTLFWALPRRPPQPLLFNPAQPDHFNFVLHSAYLFAKAYSITEVHDAKDVAWFHTTLASFQVPEFVLKENHHIETNEAVTKESAAQVRREKREEEEENQSSESSNPSNESSNPSSSNSSSNPSSSKSEWSSDDEFEDRLKSLKEAIVKKEGVLPFGDEFEKDVDSNHHIDFVTAASNLRAMQYGIQPVDRMRTKFVAGKIIPAMATSTAAITGLASLELIKLVRKDRQLEVYKNAWMNLALPSLLLSEPQAVEITPIHPTLSISIWDRWEIDQGDLALGQFINHIKSHYKLVATAIIQNTTLIYASILGGKKLLPQRLSSLLVRPTPTTPFVDLTVQFESLDGKEVRGPPVRFFFPHLDDDSSDDDSSEDDSSSDGNHSDRT